MRTLQRQYLATSWKGFTEEQGTFNYVIGDSDPEDNLAEIDVPIMLRDQLIGEISVASQEEWTPEERSMIEAIADQAALALENARLVEESRSSARREHLIADITGKIWASTTVDSILQTAAREIGRAFETDEVTIELKADNHE
jgi:GAF domain-containing protein